MSEMVFDESYGVKDKRTRWEMHKAWGAMTPREQAEHLVNVHGFEDSYYWRDNVPALAALDSREAVVEAFTSGTLTNEDVPTGESYPHPLGRDGWHEGDHEMGSESGGTPHTHA